MTSWHGNAFHVTGHLWGNPPVAGGFPSQSASNVEIWCFVWCQSRQAVEKCLGRRWFETSWCHCNGLMIFKLDGDKTHAARNFRIKRLIAYWIQAMISRKMTTNIGSPIMRIHHVHVHSSHNTPVISDPHINPGHTCANMYLLVFAGGIIDPQ